ncbi:hypothetical protein ABZ215_38605 [Amycolatopsis sp. NPDC006131]|uniref:hypothetical protein n=1 Tax=Amycolatopsis sp. NPDC006131 TaxID=3156731 RepID=UPI0033BB7AFD
MHDVGQLMARVSILYRQVGDLAVLPGAAAMNELGQRLALLAGDVLARAAEIEAEDP